MLVFIVAALIVVGLLFFVVLNFISKEKNNPPVEKVANLLERFSKGKALDNEWDDFICCPIRDSSLEKARLFCLELPKKYPAKKKSAYCSAEGMKAVSKIAIELRSKVSIKRRASKK
jgi:hypothetical protein